MLFSIEVRNEFLLMINIFEKLSSYKISYIDSNCLMLISLFNVATEIGFSDVSDLYVLFFVLFNLYSFFFGVFFF